MASVFVLPALARGESGPYEPQPFFVTPVFRFVFLLFFYPLTLWPVIEFAMRTLDIPAIRDPPSRGLAATSLPTQARATRKKNRSPPFVEFLRRSRRATHGGLSSSSPMHFQSSEGTRFLEFARYLADRREGIRFRTIPSLFLLRTRTFGRQEREKQARVVFIYLSCFTQRRLPRVAAVHSGAPA